MKIKNTAAVVLVAFIALACTDEDNALVDTGATNIGVGGKSDSSAEAVFVNMEFSGTLVSDSSFNSKSQIEDQLLFTIGHLNEQNSVGRLDRIVLSNIERFEVGDDQIRINYDVVLPVAWGNKDDVPQTYDFKIPVDMSAAAKQAFTEKYNQTCVESHAGNVEVSSMWYYYRATVPDCNLDDSDIFKATAKVTISDINTTGKYPEYHKIYEDDVLNVVAIFGKYKDGATLDRDAGIAAYNSFIRKMNGKVQFMEDAVIEPLTFRPSVNTPEINYTVPLGDGRSMKLTALLVDNVRNATPEFNARYEELSKSADLISYSGHAGLGSNVRALAAKGSWVEGQYAIFFMNGCDSYAYVDAALNEAHAEINPDDELGTKYVDIIANAMPAFFRELAQDTFVLVEALMNHQEPSTYEEIFVLMDESQVVLVSGEEDNTYVPD